MKRLVVLAAVLATPVSAYNLTRATSGKPEAVLTGSADLYVTERCIVMMDAAREPQVYRTPDRPNESLIYYSLGAGQPVVFGLNRQGTGVVVTIYNGMKWRDKIAACANS